MKSSDLRPDLKLIANMIKPSSRVLDIACGDGELLDYITHTMNVDGRGIEISQTGVNACVKRGLCVVQGDAGNDLADYSDNSFDLVVLSRALQAMHRPREVMLELLRIGKQAIITIPNFGQWRTRFSLITRGRMPVTKTLNRSWYNTDNIHFCTIADMFDLIDAEDITVQSFVPHSADGKRLYANKHTANWLADQALFLLEDKSNS